jgi:hypothetical protein
MLGQIDERYAAPGLEAERAQVRTASLDLAAAQASIRARLDAKGSLGLWLTRSRVWERSLRRAEARSYYDRRTLAAAMAL